MEIEVGLRYRMIEFPVEEPASEYCSSFGFYLGCSCELININGNGDLMLERDGVSMFVNKFFFEHTFMRDMRNENLNILLG